MRIRVDVAHNVPADIHDGWFVNHVVDERGNLYIHIMIRPATEDEPLRIKKWMTYAQGSWQSVESLILPDMEVEDRVRRDQRRAREEHMREQDTGSNAHI